MRSWVFISVGLMATACAMAADIHVPADQPTIQAGINAAQSGDRVLVAAGSYSQTFSVVAKQISLEAEGGRVRLSVGSPTTVSSEAVLEMRDFDVTVTNTSITVRRSILQAIDCSIEGLDAPDLTTISASSGRRALTASIGATIELDHCTVIGGDGGAATSQPGRGEVAVYLSSASLRALDCHLFGGAGGETVSTGASSGSGREGASAVLAFGGVVRLEGCTLTGGAGGGVHTPRNSRYAGNGDAGLEIDSGRAVIGDSILTGGAGGDSPGLLGAGGHGGDGLHCVTSAIRLTGGECRGGRGGLGYRASYPNDQTQAGHGVYFYGRSHLLVNGTESQGGAPTLTVNVPGYPLLHDERAVAAFDPNRLQDHINSNAPLSSLETAVADPSRDGFLTSEDVTLMSERFAECEAALSGL